MSQKETAIRKLVRMHATLQDKHEGAIWLQPPGVMGVVLLEIIPTMPKDDQVDEPMEFLPFDGFKYGLRLYTGRIADFERAVARNTVFAKLVAEGTVVSEETSKAERLQKAARKKAPASIRGTGGVQQRRAG